MTYLSEADFQQIENTLAIELPAHFKSFHLQHQSLIKELKELVNELDQSISLATDLESILMINQFLQVLKITIFVRWVKNKTSFSMTNDFTASTDIGCQRRFFHQPGLEENIWKCL